MASEQLTKMKGSTGTCPLFHFLFVRMPQNIMKEDDQWMNELMNEWMNEWINKQAYRLVYE